MPETEQEIKPDAEISADDKDKIETPDGEKKAEEEVDPNAEFTPDGDGKTAPEADAGAAGNAFKYRQEKRKNTELENKIANMEAEKATSGKEKPEYPVRDKFENDSEYSQAIGKYHEDLTDYKIEEREAGNAVRTAHQEHNDSIEELSNSYTKAAELAVEKYPDFYEVVEATDFTTVIQEAVFRATNKAEMAYHLAKNHSLREKLMTSSSVVVGAELTKLDMRFTRSLKKKTSETPEPIKPVDASGNIVDVDVSKLTASQYYERKQAGTLPKE